MRAVVCTCRDPFRPANHRTVDVVRRGRSLRNLAPRTRQPVICQVNGQWISRKAWARRVQDGDVVVFVCLLQGGKGSSNPLRMILMLAVTLLAPFATTALVGIEGAAALGSFGVSLVNAAIGFIGSALVNLLVPDKTAKASTAESASPTYSLTAQGNSARIGSPIPVIYGHHLVYPDYAAAPYAEYAGNEQYLYQLFCVGQGYYDIESIRIEDTPIASFPEITYEIVPPGGTVTLFPTNVVTSTEVSGQEALAIASSTTTTTSTTTTHTDSGTVFGSSSANVTTNFDGTTTVTTSASYTSPDAAAVSANNKTKPYLVGVAQSETTPSLGPFVVNPEGTKINRVAFDVVFSRGLCTYNDEGKIKSRTITWKMDVQEVDDYGDPVGVWTTLETKSVTMATPTPQRLSYAYDVKPGRYRARMTRLDAKDTSSSAAHEIDWASLRGYIPGEQQYGEITLVAMRMKATNSLSQQSSRKINMIVRRRLPMWSASAGWSSPQPTRSIAWAIADIYRAAYGGRLPDNRIGLAALAALDNVWSARGDYLDGVYDTQSTVMEAASTAARAGRAIAYQQGGVVQVARDAPASLPVAMFSQRNIVKNSFSLQYLMTSDETADAIDATYFDAKVWKSRTVRCAVPGSLQKTVATISLFGVTDRQHAYREGMYAAACNRFRRRLLTFTTEMEGFIPTLGDLIAVQHDMPSWGQSGEIVAWNAATKTAILSEPLDWSGIVKGALSFRGRDGSPRGPFAAQAGVDVYHVVLTDWALDGEKWKDGITDKNTPDTGNDRERSHFAFGKANQQFVKCRVLSAKPKSRETVEINAVVESDYVHIADTGVAPSASAWQFPATSTAPVVTGLIVRIMQGDPDKWVASWKPAVGADHYVVEQSSGDGSWTRVGETTGSTLSINTLYGADTVIRVSAIGKMPGPWAYSTDSAAIAIKPTEVSTGNVGVTVDKNLTIDFDGAGYVLLKVKTPADSLAVRLWELRLGDSFEDGKVVQTITGSTFWLPLSALLGKNVWIKALYTTGTYSAFAYAASFAGTTLPSITGLTVKVVEPTLQYTWQAVTGADHYVCYIEDGGVTTVRTTTEPLLTIRVPKYATNLRIYAVNTSGQTSEPFDQAIGIFGTYNQNEVVNIPLAMNNGTYSNLAFTSANQVEKVSLLGPSSFPTPIDNINNAGLYSFGYNLKDIPGATLQNTPGSWFRQDFWYAQNGFFESTPVDLGQVYSGRLKLQLTKTVTAYGNQPGSAFAHILGEHMAKSTGVDLVDDKAFLSAKFFVAQTMAGPWVEAADGDWVDTCRYVKIIVTAEHVSPLTDCLVTAGVLTLDVPDITETGTATTVTSAGKTITLNKSYHAISLVLVTPRAGVKAWVSNVNAAAGTVTITTDSASATDVGYFVKGF